jgi:hypothetical protein
VSHSRGFASQEPIDRTFRDILSSHLHKMLDDTWTQEKAAGLPKCAEKKLDLKQPAFGGRSCHVTICREINRGSRGG